MSAYTALLDASVLYPAPLRDVLLELATTDVYRAKWSSAINEEWINALMRNEPHRDRAALERTRALMDRATRDCLLEGYEALIPSLLLPDPNDRHVLAAAITGRCDVIFTANLKDFPTASFINTGSKRSIQTISSATISALRQACFAKPSVASARV
jgi:PIN domain